MIPDLLRWRPLIIGQAPSRTGDPDRPLTGRCGRMLAEMMGLSFLEYVRLFSRANVFDRWPGSQGKSDSFPIHEARLYAEWLKIEVAADRRPFVVLLGKSVARAFKLDGEFFVPRSLAGVPCHVVPHPSRVSLFWNEPDNVAVTSQYLRRIAVMAEEVHDERIGQRSGSRSRQEVEV